MGKKKKLNEADLKKVNGGMKIETIKKPIIHGANFKIVIQR